MGIMKKLQTCQKINRKWIIAFLANETNEQEQNICLSRKEILIFPEHSAHQPGNQHNDQTSN